MYQVYSSSTTIRITFVPLVLLFLFPFCASYTSCFCSTSTHTKPAHQLMTRDQTFSTVSHPVHVCRRYQRSPYRYTHLRTAVNSYKPLQHYCCAYYFIQGQRAGFLASEQTRVEPPGGRGHPDARRKTRHLQLDVYRRQSPCAGVQHARQVGEAVLGALAQPLR